jgi:hypothetical protein
MSPPSSAPEGRLVCSVTPWYFKRMAMMGGLLAFFALWFYKDGKWSWPEERRQAEVLTDYRRLRDDYEKAKTEGRLDAWTAETKKKEYPLGEDGLLIKTGLYAAQHNWPEDPKLRTPEEIYQQFYYAAGAGIGALVVAILVLRSRNKKLVGEIDHFLTPEGETVRFADVFRVDKRKWDNKGLAYIGYHSAKGDRTAVIDDLKYGGADKVLDRIINAFSGELIEKVDDPDDNAGASENQAKQSVADTSKV